MKNIILYILLSYLAMGNLLAQDCFYQHRFYIDSEFGSDADTGEKDCNGNIHAWQTIGKVNSYTRFSAGDTISFKCGSTFTGDSLVPPISGLTFNSYTTDNNLTKPIIDRIGSYGKCMFIVDKDNITVNGIQFLHGWKEIVYLLRCNHCTFTNCDILASTKSYIDTLPPPGMFLTELGSYLTLRGCTFKDGTGDHGLYINATPQTIVDSCEFSGNRANGINCGYDTAAPYVSNNITIKYCTIRNNGEHGLYDDGMTNSNFYYNIVENSSSIQYSGCLMMVDQTYNFNNTENGSVVTPINNHYYNNTLIVHGLGTIAWEVGADKDHFRDVSHMTGMIIQNNIINVNSGTSYGFYFRGTTLTSWTSNYNNYFIPDSGNHYLFVKGINYPSLSSWHATGLDLASIQADPEFNMNDYSLKNSSPAVLAGVWVGLIAPSDHDIVGTLIGNPPDIGAYQSIPAYKKGSRYCLNDFG